MLTAFKYLKYFDLFRKRYQPPLKVFFIWEEVGTEIVTQFTYKSSKISLFFTSYLLSHLDYYRRGIKIPLIKWLTYKDIDEGVDLSNGFLFIKSPYLNVVDVYFRVYHVPRYVKL